MNYVLWLRYLIISLQTGAFFYVLARLVSGGLWKFSKERWFMAASLLVYMLTINLGLYAHRHDPFTYRNVLILFAAVLLLIAQFLQLRREWMAEKETQHRDG